MASSFLRHGSRLAREEAVRNLEETIQRLGKLILNVSALADRLDARPTTDPEQKRERQARVAVLRAAAEAGQESIARLTAHLLRERGEPDESTLDLTDREQSASDGS